MGKVITNNQTVTGGLERLTAGVKDDEAIAIWRKQISLGLKWRYATSGNRDSSWSRYRQYYRGRWDDEEFTDVLFDRFIDNVINYLPANRVFAFIRSLLPSVYFRNPGLYVTEETQDKELIQRLFDFMVKELKVKRELKKVILDALIIGVGAAQLGFGRTIFDGNIENEPVDERIEYSNRVKKGLPWIKRIDPMLVIYPWGTTEPDDARWVAIETFMMIEDFHADPNLRNTKSLRGVKTERISSDNRTKKMQLYSDQERNSWIRLWQIRDKKTNELIIISHGNQFHFKERDPLMITNPPIHLIVFDIDLETCWGVSPVRIMEPQQLELNDQKTHAARMRRTILKKLLIDPEGIENEDTMKDINDAQGINTAIQVKDPNKNVKELTTSMSPDLANEQGRTDDDIRFAVGFGRNQAGDVNTGRRTLGEIEIANRNAELRNDERRDVAADFFEDIMINLFQFADAFMEEEFKQLISGGVWQPRNPVMVKYNLGLDVVAEEAIPVNHIAKRDLATKLYEVLANDPVVNPVTRLATLIEEHNEDPNEWFDPEISQAVMKILVKREEAAKKAEEKGKGGGE